MNKNILLCLPADLVEAIDQMAKSVGATRSGFIRVKLEKMIGAAKYEPRKISQKTLKKL